MVLDPTNQLCDKPVIPTKYRNRGLLIPQLLEIQEHRTGVDKSIEWARNLQYLHESALRVQLAALLGRLRRPELSDPVFYSSPIPCLHEFASLRQQNLSKSGFYSSAPAVFAWIRPIWTACKDPEMSLCRMERIVRRETRLKSKIVAKVLYIQENRGGVGPPPTSTE